MVDRMKLLALLACAIIGSTTAIAQDEPDPYFIDVNGDGIDGVLTDAIFVAPPPAGNNMNDGLSTTTPVATITFGISRAVTTARSQVLVQVGTYNESITLVGGVSIYGGYDAAWARVASTATTATVINGTTTTAVFADAITSPTTVSFLTLRPANASSFGASSYAMRLRNSSGPITLRYNRFEPGIGFDANDAADAPPRSPVTAPGGTPGQSGLTTNGGPARSGGIGGSNPTCPSAANIGGAGGSGGIGSSGTTGGTGMTGSGGANGGNGGASSTTLAGDGVNGVNGDNGAAGAAGAHSPAAVATVGVLDSIPTYIPPSGTAAVDGTHGSSGAGGGGGGGQDCSVGCTADNGAGGGGGGAGGCGGFAASSGSGGGASFGVVVDASSNAQISDNLFKMAMAGSGGDGGDGGVAQAGGGLGAGGIKVADAGSGGSGGNGGNGGRGGSGSGGHGGPAVGILDPVDRATAIGNRYLQAPTAAAGGSNGINNIAVITPGVRQFKYPSNVATLGIPAASVNDIVAAEPGSGSANANFTVILAAASDAVVSIDYTLNGTGGATPGADFTSTPGTVTFNPWTTTATVAVPILADAEVESPEQFQLVLTAPVGISNFTLADGTGIGTIVSDGIFQNSFE